MSFGCFVKISYVYKVGQNVRTIKGTSVGRQANRMLVCVCLNHVYMIVKFVSFER